jgi:hypothetical protein
MAEVEQAVPAQADNAAPPTASTPAVTAPATDKPAATEGVSLSGSGKPSADFTGDLAAVLTDENREIVKNKGWKDINAAILSYKELQSKLGKAIEAPAPDADKATLDAFYAKIGRPETPEGYKLALPEGVPQDALYDAGFAAQFRAWAHEAGLTPKQASALHDKYVLSTMSEVTSVREKVNTNIKTAHNEIVKEWGDTESESYKRNVELARRTLDQLDLKETYREAGFIDPITGMITNAKVAKALARIGAKMYSEDTMFAGPGAHLDNPFSQKSFNMTKQAQLIKSDPHKATVLIRASGQNPADFGLS